MKFIQKLIFSSIFFLFPIFLIAQSTESSNIDDDKIHVSVTGKETTFKEVRVETIIHAPIDSVVAFVTNIDNYKNWMFKCQDSKMLKSYQADDYIYYVEIDMPYPTTNRDVVIRSNYIWTVDKKSFHITSKAENDFLAKDDDFVRVEELETEWKIEEISPGKTRVIHLNKINPGGNLPLWMINLAAETGPMKTVKKLKKILDAR